MTDTQYQAYRELNTGFMLVLSMIAEESAGLDILRGINACTAAAPLYRAETNEEDHSTYLSLQNGADLAESCPLSQPFAGDEVNSGEEFVQIFASYLSLVATDPDHRYPYSYTTKEGESRSNWAFRLQEEADSFISWWDSPGHEEDYLERRNILDAALKMLLQPGGIRAYEEAQNA